MARYIDVDKIKDFVANMTEEVSYEWAWTLTALDKVPTENVIPIKWISVNDKIPKNNLARVLVFLKDDEFTKNIGFNRIDTDRCIDGKWVRWGKHVTHWMPLPEPPKQDKDVLKKEEE